MGFDFVPRLLTPENEGKHCRHGHGDGAKDVHDDEEEGVALVHGDVVELKLDDVPPEPGAGRGESIQCWKVGMRLG